MRRIVFTHQHHTSKAGYRRGEGWNPVQKARKVVLTRARRLLDEVRRQSIEADRRVLSHRRSDENGTLTGPERREAQIAERNNAGYAIVVAPALSDRASSPTAPQTSRRRSNEVPNDSDAVAILKELVSIEDELRTIRYFDSPDLFGRRYYASTGRANF